MKSPIGRTEIEPPGVPIGDTFLLREVHHRVGNMLTILAIGLRRELAPFRNPQIAEALSRHERQIIDLSTLYRLLGNGDDGGERSIDGHFRPLLDLLFRAVLAPAGIRGEAFIVDGPLGAQQCGNLALVVTELVINAAKHAFPGDAGGAVRVTLERIGPAWLCSVADDGIGLRNPAAGGGSQIVGTLVNALGGTIRIRSGSTGTVVSVAFPPMGETEC